ncbi:MAG: hypothetical protein NUV61_02340 [Candidatus Azambacteria bacterium]|nr:hypothetical protein [Candidatus Azambacteria bacterium]
MKKLQKTESPMLAFDDLLREAIRFLEMSEICHKHHVKHTGKRAYLLDFYICLGEVEKGKTFVEYLLSHIVESKAGKIFYPGLMDPRNESSNAIDTGASVDAIARFLHVYRESFTREEHVRYKKILGEVAETYLKNAAAEKRITNQRLWGLTGLASYARYADTNTYDDLIRASVERAFSDMTEDGFFIYYPRAEDDGFCGYDGLTTHYQSRCTTFIRYSLEAAGIDVKSYEQRLQRSERALLSMYCLDGTKDLRMECKRWYWLSTYEVASAGFDSYALAYSSVPEAKVALHNLLFQVRRHLNEGYLRSHIGAPINYQCPIFWTAHLAWMLRVRDVKRYFDAASSLKDFSFRFEGREVFTDTSPSHRALINARWQRRNANEGIYENGLKDMVYWRFNVPALPSTFLFSVHELAVHTRDALRGWYIRECVLRLLRFAKELIVMLLPRYSVRYGKIESFTYNDNAIDVVVSPATKYGTILHDTKINIRI